MRRPPSIKPWLTPEEMAACADLVPQIKLMKQFKTALSHHILANVNLQSSAISLHVSKTGFAH